MHYVHCERAYFILATFERNPNLTVRSRCFFNFYNGKFYENSFFFLVLFCLMTFLSFINFFQKPTTLQAPTPGLPQPRARVACRNIHRIFAHENRESHRRKLDWLWGAGGNTTSALYVIEPTDSAARHLIFLHFAARPSSPLFYPALALQRSGGARCRLHWGSRL